MSRFGFAVILILLGGVVQAQTTRVSEREVEMETRFIDANRERILGNYDKAIPIYEEILKKDKDNFAAAYELARVYEAQEEYEKAARYASQAVEGEPDNVWYQQFLAEIYQNQGLNEEAAAIFEKLLRTHPENEEYYTRMAYFLVRANKVEEAIKVYDRLENRIGVTEEVIRRKHSLYLGIGDTKKAADELQRLIDAFPNDTEYRHLLAGFYEQMGDAEKSREIYRQILRRDPDDAKARLALAGAQEATDSGDQQYLNSLRPIFEDPEVDIDLKVKRLIPIIQKVANSNDVQLGNAALELTDILERVHPDEAKVYSAAGDLLYYTGQRQAAIRKYEKTLTLDDTVYSVWEQLLYSYLEEEDFETLRERAEEAMDYFPNKASAYYLYGLACNETGAQEDALDGLEQALLMAGDDNRLNFQIQARLGLVYHALEEYDRSDAAFQGALKLNPESPEVLNNFSYRLAVRGERLKEAEQMSGEVIKRYPDQPAFLDTYGWVQYKMKNFEEAKKWIGRALEKGGTDDPFVLEHYGDILFQLGEQEEALQYWNQALETGSTSKLLERKINDKQLYE